MKIWNKEGSEFSFINGKSILYLPLVSIKSYRVNVFTIFCTENVQIKKNNDNLKFYRPNGEEYNILNFADGTTNVFYVLENYQDETIQTNEVIFTAQTETLSLIFITESLGEDKHLLNQVNSISPIPYEEDDYLLYNFDKNDNLKKDSKLREMLLEFPQLKPYVGSAKYTEKAFKLFGLDNYNLYELRKTIGDKLL